MPRILLPAALRSLRLHQWIKNALVFVPLMLGGRAGDFSAWQNATIGFIAFGLTASGTYIVNDLRDRDHDRVHPTKRTRPIADGTLTPGAATVLAVACVTCGLALSLSLGQSAFAAALAYVVLTLAYTFALKALALFDVLAIASLFTLRLAFGVVVADVRWSPWLLVLSMCSFISLALAKRFAELTSTKTGERLAGRGYSAVDIPFIRGVGLASSTTSVLIMIIYLIAEAFPRATYSHPERLWIVPAILFVFFGRIWLAAERQELDDDPIVFALKDQTCLFCALCLQLAFIAAVS